MKGLTDIPGIKVGHASNFDAITGCTAILCEAGAVAGVDIRGGATGTEEMDALNPGHVTTHVHAVLLAGGSAFGLEAASGVRRYLERRGVGFKTGAAVVPIVPAAILYDLGIGRADIRPSREMGESAAAAATDGPVEEGSVGAGTGATAGKILGMKQAMKSGLGTFTISSGPLLVSALAAANPLGDILDAATGKILAGARVSPDSREFAGAARVMRERFTSGSFSPRNTTLAVVATNARLSKVQATHISRVAHHGFVRAISPVHTMMDGDLAITLSCGAVEAPLDLIGVLAADAVAQAIARAARSARTLGGVPGLASA